MGIEIERKFLVADDRWRAEADPQSAATIHQGFLSRDPERVVRVRLWTPLAGGEAQGFLTVKGLAQGAERAEFEYPIPEGDARELLALCLPLPVHKVRWRVPAGEGRWFEIDEFLSPHRGLVLVELELASRDEPFPRPPWLGAEVTSDPAYSNSALSAEGARLPAPLESGEKGESRGAGG